MVTRKNLKQIGTYLYEIPQDFREDMRVPARIYADDTIINAALQDRSIEQLINTATLPGIVRYALAMPDIHQGYGFSIGGVIATRVSDGVVSPGGVGYDINCLTADSEVLHEHGYTSQIGDMIETWVDASITCYQLETSKQETTSLRHFLAYRPQKLVVKLATESGKVIRTTTDHPIWTKGGMVPLGRLKVGDQVAILPFDGVPYQAPGDTVLVDEADLRGMLGIFGKSDEGNAVGQIVTALKRSNLLPIRLDSVATPYLCKVLGYLFGDGSIHFEQKSGKGVVSFYGKRKDLELIRADLQRLGMTPSKVYSRERNHRISTTYDDYQFQRVETFFKVRSTGFAVLMACLGAPVGKKAGQDYEAPVWLEDAPLWHKRLFLAAFFGAELTSPKTVSGHPYNIASPVLSQNKRAANVQSGHLFLERIADWLQEFGILTRPIAIREEQINVNGSQSLRLRLVLQADPDNLINLWSKIGYEYNQERRHKAAVAVHYLLYKMRHIERRQVAAEQTVAMAEAGTGIGEIMTQLADSEVNRRFIQRSLYDGRATSPRVAQSFPTFDEFLQEMTAGLDASGMVWDRITSLEEINYGGLVYDCTVHHPDHNFVANGFVVSNCGVRLLSSDMEESDVKPYLSELATALYQQIPSGVGVAGFLKLSEGEVAEVLETGSRWALKKGMARKEDLVHTEEQGTMPGARADKVSVRAKSRGRNQVGTLGAGNHFAEIDVVDEVFDDELAQAFGLFPGQVVLQIHCGSRGLGHQVCTDYVQRFQSVIKRYGIILPDRQLVCAPIESPEGQDYIAAMAAAANYAWANRQTLAHQARRAFEDVLAGRVRGYDLRMVYDIAHNMAKLETHDVHGEVVPVCVHRKGATRAFGPTHPVLPPDYSEAGQPVLVPGSMGTASYVLAGTEGSMRQTFGSTCHGAGRQMSRKAAKRQVHGGKLKEQLQQQGIEIRAGSLKGLAEEAPIAYKDVSRVVDVVHNAGIANKVARLRPIAVVKG